MKDCVATAPTPASAQVTVDPTENQCDCTATPRSPVTVSRATMEKVCTRLPRTPLLSGAAACMAGAVVSEAVRCLTARYDWARSRVSLSVLNTLPLYAILYAYWLSMSVDVHQ